MLRKFNHSRSCHLGCISITAWFGASTKQYKKQTPKPAENNIKRNHRCTSAHSPKPVHTYSQETGKENHHLSLTLDTTSCGFLLSDRRYRALFTKTTELIQLLYCCYPCCTVQIEHTNIRPSTPTAPWVHKKLCWDCHTPWFIIFRFLWTQNIWGFLMVYNDIQCLLELPQEFVNPVVLKL